MLRITSPIRSISCTKAVEYGGPSLHGYRMPRPRGRALGRAPLAPRVAYRFAAEPRVVPLVVPLVGAEYFDVGLEETVLGGCSTKEVSVVLASQLISMSSLLKIRVKNQASALTGKSSHHRPPDGVARFRPLRKALVNGPHQPISAQPRWCHSYLSGPPLA